MSTQENYTSSLQIEHRSIDYIPASERHGTPNRLFFIWFGANMQVTAAATGAIAVANRAVVALGAARPAHRQPLRRHVHGGSLRAGAEARHSPDDPEPGPVRLLRRDRAARARPVDVRRLLRRQRDPRRRRSGRLVGHQRQAGHCHRLPALRGARDLRLPHDSPVRAVDQPGERPRLRVPHDPAADAAPHQHGLALRERALRHVPAGHHARRHLADHLRALRRGLQPLPAREHQQGGDLLVDRRGLGHRLRSG